MNDRASQFYTHAHRYFFNSDDTAKMTVATWLAGKLGRQLYERTVQTTFEQFVVWLVNMKCEAMKWARNRNYELCAQQ